MSQDRMYRVSSRQLWLLFTLLGLCVTPLLLPGLVIPVLGRYAWVAGVYALAGGLVGTAVAAALIRQMPDRSLDEIAVAGLGPLLGGTYLTLLAGLFTAGAALNLHAFTSVAAAHDLPLLGRAYPAFLIASVGTLAAYFGPEVIARSAEVLAPLVAVGIVTIHVLALTNARFGHVLPLQGVPLGALGEGPVLAALGTARGFLLLLVLGPFARNLPSTSTLNLGTAIASLLINTALLLPIAVFGAPFAALQRFPFISAVGTSRWQWVPTQEATVLLLLLWHAIIFVVFASYVWLAAWLWRRLLPRLPWPAAVLGVGFLGGLFASSSLQASLMLLLFDLWNNLVVLLGIAVPAVILLALHRRAFVARPQRA